jgi:hypothetical protein
MSLPAQIRSPGRRAPNISRHDNVIAVDRFWRRPAPEPKPIAFVWVIAFAALLDAMIFVPFVWWR